MKKRKIYNKKKETIIGIHSIMVADGGGIVADQIAIQTDLEPITPDEQSPELLLYSMLENTAEKVENEFGVKPQVVKINLRAKEDDELAEKSIEDTEAQPIEEDITYVSYTMSPESIKVLKRSGYKDQIIFYMNKKGFVNDKEMTLVLLAPEGTGAAYTLKNFKTKADVILYSPGN